MVAKSSYQERLAKAKEVVGAPPVKKEQSNYNATVYELGIFIEQRRASYTKTAPSYSYISRMGNKGRVFTLVEKVVLECFASGIPFDDWVEAQYYWFHKWFKRTPQLHELGSENARKRYQDWLQIKKATPRLAVSAVSPVTERIDQHTKSKSTLFTEEEALLAKLMKRWELPEEDIYRSFGNPEAEVFSSKFLHSRDLWKKVAKEKEWI